MWGYLWKQQGNYSLYRMRLHECWGLPPNSIILCPGVVVESFHWHLQDSLTINLHMHDAPLGKRCLWCHQIKRLGLFSQAMSSGPLIILVAPFLHQRKMDLIAENKTLAICGLGRRAYIFHSLTTSENCKRSGHDCEPSKYKIKHLRARHLYTGAAEPSAIHTACLLVYCIFFKVGLSREIMRKRKSLKIDSRQRC